MFLSAFGGGGFEVFPVGDGFMERGQSLEWGTVDSGEG